MITKEPATVYRVGRRRYFSLKGAIRAEARLIAYAEFPDRDDDSPAGWNEIADRVADVEKNLKAQYRGRAIPAAPEPRT